MGMADENFDGDARTEVDKYAAMTGGVGYPDDLTARPSKHFNIVTVRNRLSGLKAERLADFAIKKNRDDINSRRKSVGATWTTRVARMTTSARTRPRLSFNIVTNVEKHGRLIPRPWLWRKAVVGGDVTEIKIMPILYLNQMPLCTVYFRLISRLIRFW